MIDGTLVINNGLYYVIVVGQNCRVMLKALRKRSDAKFEYAHDYIRARCVFRRDEEVLTDWKIVNLGQLSNTTTSKVRRDTCLT